MTDKKDPRCSNEDHARPPKAVARVTWPDGSFRSETACVGCMGWLTRRSIREDGIPIHLEPIKDTGGADE